MKVLLIAALSLFPAAAQQAAAPVPTPTPTPTPVEQAITGSVEVGYRWRTGVAGSLDSYRSIVNLGSGPKLLNADLTILDPAHRLFDVMRVRATTWGGDPYSTFHLDARKSGLYDFNADYRDFAYFNALPSFADPLLSRGIVLNEQAFDLRRRLGSFQLDLLPGGFFTPYLSYERDSSSGTGVSTFVSDQNEYPVPERDRDLTNVFRAGVRFGRSRYHGALETGGTTFKEDQSLYQNGGTNVGNRNTPYLGRQLYLGTLLAGTGVRGSSIFEKALISASPADWIDISGQFLYSEPQTDVRYQQAITGQFVSQAQLLFYSTQQFLLASSAKMPHTAGNATIELRPHRRIRLVESWLTDRLHSAGAAPALSSSLLSNYSQQETDVLLDIGAHLTVRGGYRYVWGEARDAVLPFAGLTGVEVGHLRRNVGIGAVTYRRNPKLSVTAEGEVASSSGAYFRTSPYDYQKARAQVRYQLRPDLNLSADFTFLNNHNPVTGIRSDFVSTQGSVSVFWTPAGGKRWDVLGTYSRTDLHSDIGYLSPEDLLPQLSRYRENVHTGTGLLNLNLAAAKISAGGSFAVLSGSRPTTYFQPLAKVSIPVHKSTALFAEWRYYGYGEAFYLYEAFRTHIVTAGVRFTR